MFILLGHIYSGVYYVVSLLADNFPTSVDYSLADFSVHRGTCGCTCADKVETIGNVVLADLPACL